MCSKCPHQHGFSWQQAVRQLREWKVLERIALTPLWICYSSFKTWAAVRLIAFIMVMAGEQRPGAGTRELPTAPEHSSHLLAPHLLSILGTVYLLRVFEDDRPFSSYSSESTLLSVCVLVAQSYLTLCDPIDCGPPAPLAMEFPRQEYRSGISVEQSGSRACILKLQIFPDLPCGSGGSATSDSWDPVDCRPPGSSVHRISQARILEYLPFPSPGDLPDPGIEPRSPALQVDSLLTELQGKPL